MTGRGAARHVHAAIGASLLAASSMAAAQDSAVHDLVGTPTCTADAQCRTLAYGAKACGGPQAYLAWSTLVSDEAALRAAAEQFAARRREELRASGMASDCRLVTDPGALCAAPSSNGSDTTRTCVLRGAKPGRGKVAQ